MTFVYDKLVAKVNDIDTNGYVLKTKFRKHLILVSLLKKQIIVLKLVE